VTPVHGPKAVIALAIAASLLPPFLTRPAEMRSEGAWGASSPAVVPHGSLAPGPMSVCGGPTARDPAAAGVGFRAPNAGSGYVWPVQGPVIRGFTAPPDPYSAGHRGIDIAAPFGTPLHAAQDGTVAFAGSVAGALYISIDHPDGVRTTYSWLSAITVTKGQAVVRDQLIGSTGHGHPEIVQPHLHFGAKLGSTYIDPMTLLGTGSVVGLIRLAPLGGPAGAPSDGSIGQTVRC
jgi:murein DD-endopeptidase MepM/ murein hydrolase activator NlpD